MTARQRKWIYLILAIGLVIRMVLPLILGGDPYRGDGADYIRYAMNLHEHGIFSGQFEDPEPQAGRMPGVPLIIWLGLQFFALDSWGMLLPNILLGWGMLVLLHFFLHDLKIKPQIHLVAISIYAIFPTIDYYAAQFYPEVPAAFFMFLSLWSFYRYLKSGSGKWMLVTGLALGIGLYFRPEIILPLPILMGGVLLTTYSPRQKMVHTFVLIASVIMVLAPWTLRNLQTQGTFMPLGKNFLIEDFFEKEGTCSKGLYKWLNTWHYKESHLKTAGWYFWETPIEDFPETAIGNSDEKEVLKSIKTQSKFSCAADAELNGLAIKKRNESPFKFYVILPLKRCFHLIIRTERADNKEGEYSSLFFSLAWLGLALFTALIHLLGMIIPFIKSRPKGISLVLWLVIIERMIFFAWIYHVEYRYMLVFFPLFFLLAVEGINRLFQDKIQSK